MNTIIDTIYQRRSIRKFEEKPVAHDQLIELIKLAMAAPSASNSQPLEFILTTDLFVLSQIRAKMRYANYNAPAAILVLGNPQKAANASGKRFWVQDGSAAIENILIGAVAMGLGTCWIGVHPVPPFEREVRTIFQLPDHVFPLGIVLVGYPAETPEPRTQFDPAAVHWDRYPAE
jgi:nitroreductase